MSRIYLASPHMSDEKLEENNENSEKIIENS